MPERSRDRLGAVVSRVAALSIRSSVRAVNPRQAKQNQHAHFLSNRERRARSKPGFTAPHGPRLRSSASLTHRRLPVQYSKDNYLERQTRK